MSKKEEKKNSKESVDDVKMTEKDADAAKTAGAEDDGTQAQKENTDAENPKEASQSSEYARHKKEETTDQLSENDLKRLAKIIQSRPIIAEIKLNEKTIAKEIIDPIQEGLDKQKKLRNMIGGVKE